MKSFSSVVLAVMGMTLAACGGGAKLGGGKEGAAQALNGAARPYQSGTGAQSSPLTSGAFTFGTTTEVTGRHGGTAKVTVDVGVAQTGISQSMTVVYSGFNDDGKNRYDGTLTVSNKVAGTTGSLTTESVVAGKLTISGEISDFIDVNVTQKVSLTSGGSGSTAAAVSVTMDGTVTTSTETYTYANEAFSFDVNASLPAQVPSKP
ncbi:MAG: hypothetical protein ACT4TC_02125 [Myxococcaceae bacterium]